MSGTAPFAVLVRRSLPLAYAQYAGRAHVHVVLRECVLLALLLLSGCDGLNSQTYAYATLDEARAAGAITNGWVPDGLPASSHDLRVAQVPGTPQHWGIINFSSSDEDALRALLEPREVSLTGERCEMPARIEWWPVILRGELDGERLAATGIRGYRAKRGNRLFAINWNQGRAYYWGSADEADGTR